MISILPLIAFLSFLLCPKGDAANASDNSGARAPISVPALDFSQGLEPIFGATDLPALAKALKNSAAQARGDASQLAPLSAILTAALEPEGPQRSKALASMLVGDSGGPASQAAATLRDAIKTNGAKHPAALAQIRKLHERLLKDPSVAALTQGFDQAKKSAESEDSAVSALDPLRTELPKDLLQRPTRLQKLLGPVHFDDLKATDKNPQVQELLAESGKSSIQWRSFPHPADTALRYVEYFSLDDLIYMAASEPYAKKVAGDLRTYANVKMGGATSYFKNDTIYWAARILADRWRLKNEGFPIPKNDEEFRIQASKAGAKPQIRGPLYLASALPPEKLKAQNTLGTASRPTPMSIIEVSARLYKSKAKDEASAFAKVNDKPGEWDGLTPITSEQAKAVLLSHLKSFDPAKSNYYGEELREAADFHQQTVDKIIRKITKASTGFEYETEKMTVAKIGTLNGNAAALPVPVSKIKRYRRFYRIDCEYKSENRRDYRHDSDYESRNAFVFIADDWHDFDSPTAVPTENTPAPASPNTLSGKTFVFTGELSSMTRAEAEKKVSALGGKASGSISTKTSYVVVGSGSGEKLRKAQALGIPQLTEAEFLKLVSK